MTETDRERAAVDRALVEVGRAIHALTPPTHHTRAWWGIWQAENIVRDARERAASRPADTEENTP